MYGLDLKVSKCFLLSNGDSVCGLRINLAGREPEGLVQPGADMDSLCDQLAQDFSEIVDLDTGLPIVKSVRRTAMLYQGEHLEYLPDLLIEWNDDKSLGGNPRGSAIRVGSDKIGVVEGVYEGRRTGDHRADGMFVAMGPGIKPGRMERVVSIMDFAPTFTHLLGVELPDVDGKLITEILGSN
jgi:predicted AlkP superfamily phosphohydrolase/phosphomutase